MFGLHDAFPAVSACPRCLGNPVIAKLRPWGTNPKSSFGVLLNPVVLMVVDVLWVVHRWALWTLAWG